MFVVYLNYGNVNGKSVHLVRDSFGRGKVLNSKQLDRFYKLGLNWRYAN